MSVTRARRLLVIPAVVAATLAFLVAPPAASSRDASGVTSVTTMFPGSAVRGDPAQSFTVGVVVSGLAPSQTVKSARVSLPESGWSVTGPVLGSGGPLGWSTRSLTATSVCWGGRQSLPSDVTVDLAVTAATTAELGTATWTVTVFGDSACSKPVKPTMADPTGEAFLAVAQVGEPCPATESCATPVTSDSGRRSSVAVTATGPATDTSFVSAAVFDSLDGDFGTLTCPQTPSYDPSLGRTAQTVVTGAAREHVIEYTLAKDLVTLVPDNGAEHMQVCLRSTIAFATAEGGTAVAVGQFQAPGSGELVTMYDGFVPRCATPAVAPCVLDAVKRNGDMLWRLLLPPGDPYVH